MSEPLSVALVSPGPIDSVGGVESVVWALARELVAADQRVEVWAQAPDTSAPSTTGRDGVVIRQFPVLVEGRFRTSPSLWRHVRRSSAGFDVLHTHNYHSTASATVLAAVDTALVLTAHYHGGGHTPLASALHRPYRAVGRRALARADRVVAVSRAELVLLERDFPAVAATVIGNGVDSADITAAQPLDEPPTLLVMGRQESYKRIDRAIEAFHRTSAPGQLVIVGDGQQRPELELRAAAGQRAAGIRFLGYQPRPVVLSWLRTARAVVNLSEHEAFGLVALEGVTAGARAVLSDIPAHTELAETLGTERVRIVGGELPDLIDQFDRALASPAVAPAPVRDWGQVAAEHLALYRELTSAR